MAQYRFVLAFVFSLFFLAMNTAATSQIHWQLNTGWCISATASAGSQLQIDFCNSSDQRQFWTFESNLAIVQSGSGLCLGSSKSEASNGTPVIVGKCNDSGIEQFDPMPSGLIEYHNGGRCFAVNDGQQSVGNNIVLWECNQGDPNQIFHWS